MTTDAIQLSLDGEPISGTNLRFEILPGALELCLPKESPLLGSLDRGPVSGRR